jgi:arginase
LSVRFIGMPFHSGRRGVGMARGPEVLLAGRDGVHWIGEPDEAAPEAARIFELNRRLAAEVAAADGFPVVVSGNCNACVGAIAGSGARAIAWFDAHADFNTPDTSRSGFIDGMSLAIATGGCWHALAASVPGFRPVPEEDVALHGVRDLDDTERARLERSRIAVNPTHGPGSAVPVYLHVDLDVLDPSEGRVNEFAAPGGLTTAQLVEAVREIAARSNVAAASVTAYNPDVDSDGRAHEAALRVIDAVAEALG